MDIVTLAEKIISVASNVIYVNAKKQNVIFLLQV